MAKKIHVRPGKGQSKFGFAVGIIFCLIGLFIAIPMFGLFGILWTAFAGFITYVNYRNGFTNKQIDSHVIEIDENGEEITAPEQVGELVYEGANVTLGYASSREDLAKGDERQGRLVTGDMAKMDEDGYYYIVGRKKRFLKIFGNRVNLDETDRMIKKQYQDMECASTGVDDKMKVFITDASLTEEVRRFLSLKTHLSESAFEVLFIEEIPKNEAGKTLYKNLPA